jgi:hypothetical protein
MENSDFDCKFFLVVVGCAEVEMEYRLRGVLHQKGEGDRDGGRFGFRTR